MDKKVNISKIATDLGVSVSTVSRAISGTGRISEKTRKKVDNYISEHNLVPNSRIQRYSSVKTGIIAVVISNKNSVGADSYFMGIFMSVYDYFSIRGYQVCMIMITSVDFSNLEQAIDEHVMDGVILACTTTHKKEIELLKEKEVPFVVVGTVLNKSIMQVDINNESASYAMTSALFSKGLYRIAVMCSEKDMHLYESRKRGILKAHVEQHMVLEKSSIFYNIDSDNIADMVLVQCLKDKMDCVLCMNDEICMRLLKSTQKYRIKIPEDIRIASLHNNIILEQWVPPVSCVSFDVCEMGKEGARILYTYLSEGIYLENRFLPYELNMRGSTE